VLAVKLLGEFEVMVKSMEGVCGSGFIY
jgi:hypothetical protein